MNRNSKKIKVTCKGADVLPIDSLEDFQGGLKKITKANLEKLKNRIIRDGINAPLFVWRTGKWCRILDGHQRLKALTSLREEGWELPLIPVAYIDADNEKDARQKLLGITSQYGEFELEELGEWMAELDADIAETVRLADGEIKIKQNIETENDDELPEDVKPVTKLGDLWELGRHRVLCGDSTKEEDVKRLMDGKKADMVFTDPPYGMNLDTDYSKMPGTKTHYRKVIGDEKEFDMTKVFENIKSPVWYVWGADYLYKTIPNFDEGVYIVWSKRMSDEENKVFGSAYELCWTFPKRKKEVWFVRGINQSSERLGEHPTQKPTELCIRALKQNENAKNIVDFFGGSGSTLIACEQTNRICYGMELDEHYCDVIVKRYYDWMIANNKKPIIKLNGKPYKLC